MTTTTTQWAQDAAREIDDENRSAAKCETGAYSDIETNSAIIARHAPPETRTTAGEALVRVVERAVVVGVLSPDDIYEAKCALAAYRSLPPAPQDAALTDEREELLRRAMEYIRDFPTAPPHPTSHYGELRTSILADAAKLRVTTQDGGSVPAE